MGNCLSSENIIIPNGGSAGGKNNGQSVAIVSSSRQHIRKNRENLIAKRDFMGIKKSDSIDNFYDIESVIGRGAFGEVVRAKHVYTDEVRAIKII